MYVLLWYNNFIEPQLKQVEVNLFKNAVNVSCVEN